MGELLPRLSTQLIENRFTLNMFNSPVDPSTLGETTSDVNTFNIFKSLKQLHVERVQLFP